MNPLKAGKIFSTTGKILPKLQLCFNSAESGEKGGRVWWLSNTFEDEKDKNQKKRIWGFCGSQLSARHGSNYQLKLLSSVWCLCKSVSQWGSSTVCSHGNHKDVALTIIALLYRCPSLPHAHTQGKSNDQSNSKVTFCVLQSLLRLCCFICCLNFKTTFVLDDRMGFHASAAALLHIQATTESSAAGKEATPQELFKFNKLLKGILTCLLYGYLLCSPSLPLAFYNQQLCV